MKSSLKIIYVTQTSWFSMWQAFLQVFRMTEINKNELSLLSLEPILSISWLVVILIMSSFTALLHRYMPPLEFRMYSELMDMSFILGLLQWYLASLLGVF